MAQKRWFGTVPDVCQVCFESLENEDYFFDSNHQSPHAQRLIWGILCEDCFKTLGTGLGIGRGQQYENTPPYLKVEEPQLFRVVGKLENGSEVDLTETLLRFAKEAQK